MSSRSKFHNFFKIEIQDKKTFPTASFIGSLSLVRIGSHNSKFCNLKQCSNLRGLSFNEIHWKTCNDVALYSIKFIPFTKIIRQSCVRGVCRLVWASFEFLKQIGNFQSLPIDHWQLQVQLTKLPFFLSSSWFRLSVQWLVRTTYWANTIVPKSFSSSSFSKNEQPDFHSLGFRRKRIEKGASFLLTPFKLAKVFSLESELQAFRGSRKQNRRFRIARFSQVKSSSSEVHLKFRFADFHRSVETMFVEEHRSVDHQKLKALIFKQEHRLDSKRTWNIGN